VNREWVVDASPLVTLGKVSQMALLERMSSDLVIPEGVALEVDQGSADDPASVWIHGEGASWVRRVAEIHPIVLSWDLGKGETEVISWAFQDPAYEAILDDRAARKCASALGIPVRGTIGIILLAKRAGVLPLAKPLLSQLTESGFRIAPELLRAAYKLAGEE